MKYIFILFLSVLFLGASAQQNQYKKVGAWVMYAAPNDSTHGIDSFAVFDPVHDTIQTTIILRDTVTITYPQIHDTLYKFVYKTDTIHESVTYIIHDTIYQAPPITKPVTLFNSQAVTGALGNDGTGGIELGVKFRSSVPGSIIGIKYYRIAGNTGTHIGELYYSSGVRMASATFTGETASGWQTVLFPTPVKIAANTTYIASYFSPGGYYTNGGNNYFTKPVTSGPLTALVDGTDGVNGVYRYSNTPALPVDSYQGSNYWVDVIFQP
jgi:hypothetical protein